MKLKQYLIDGVDDVDLEKMTDWQKIINKDCKQYVKEVGLFDTPIDRNNIFTKVLFRGFQTPPPDWRIEKNQVRKDRRPRYIPERLHKHLGDLTKEMFGWNTRTEGLFTGSFSIAGSFGQPRVVIPIGKYRYIYLGDDELETLYIMYDLWLQQTPYDELEEIVKKYNPSGLRPFLRSRKGNDRWEYIVNCKEYYVMSMDIIKQISGNSK